MGCADVDECASGAHHCHENARCENTHGAFRCTCSAGYSGNGESCARMRLLPIVRMVSLVTNVLFNVSFSEKLKIVLFITVAPAVCEKSCANGGRCVAPNTCLCVYGFTGSYCERGTLYSLRLKIYNHLSGLQNIQ